ncbi:TPA: hypothetical protein ACHVKA_000121 [Yersinia enterocolitica]
MFRALNLPLPVNDGGGFWLQTNSNGSIYLFSPLRVRCHQPHNCARFAKAIRT